MKITQAALTLMSLLTSSTYATAKEVNTLRVGSYSSNNDRKLLSSVTPLSWQKQGALLEPRDETLAVVDRSCFNERLKYSRSMSLSQDGLVLAVGYETHGDMRCYYTGDGVVEVYDYSFTQQRWIPRGGIISNKGSRTSLSADGNILVTGQYEGQVDSGMMVAGVVYAFQYDSTTQDWTPMGEIFIQVDDLNVSENLHFGYSVATSGDGQMIAIGHPGKSYWDYYGGGYFEEEVTGRTHIYSHNGEGTWTKVGAEIKGQFKGEELGRIVSLSKDGMIVAIASSKHIEVFQMNDQDEWLQLGIDIGRSPKYMSLSTNGGYISAVFPGEKQNYLPDEPDESAVYKYSSSNAEWTILVANDTWVSGSDLRILSIVDDGETIYFKYQGASASSYGPTTYGPTIVAPNEEGNGIQTESFSIIVDTQSPTPAPKPAPTPVRKPTYTPTHTPLGKGKGSKSKGSKSKNTKSKNTKSKSAKSDKSSSLKSKKQAKEAKSHKSYSKKSGKKSAK